MAAEPTAIVGARGADTYDGHSAASIARRLGLPRVDVYASVASTMDVAHALAAAGAPAGTLVLADEQTAGRGRQGNPWRSARGCGIWLTALERPDDPSGVDVLSLRVGLAAARALEQFASSPVRVKWPNDLFVAGGKVAGVLVEARWRAGRPDWVAVGLGANLRPPADVPGAAGLREAASRIDVVTALIPAMRDAASRRGPLDARELGEYAERDFATGRRCVLPSRGVVAGITANGELIVETTAGVRYHRAGSLAFEEGA